MANQSKPSGDATVSAKLTALTALAEHRDYLGLTPFGGIDSSNAEDRAARMLSEAGCILAMLSAAFDDAQTLIGGSKGSEFNARSGKIMAGALDGVGTLIDLAAFTLDDR